MIKTSVNTGVMSSGKVGVKRGVFICKNIYNRYSDLNAKQFMYATGISNNQIKDAIYRLCIDLKMAGIFDKCTAIYPFVGGTATTHRFNLRDPRDLNAAFRLQFLGGGTHSANGYSPGGVNGYANTFLATNILTSNSHHFSAYCRTAQTANAVVLGATNTLLPSYVQLNVSTGTGLFYYSGALTTEVGTALSNSTGFFVGTTRASNDRKTFRNGAQQGQLTTSINTTYNALNVFVGARNTDGTPSQFSGQQLAFTSIGLGLTDAETAIYNTIVQSFQTTLGRNV